MKKTKIFLIMLIMLSLILFSCSKDSTGPGNEKPGIPSNPNPEDNATDVSVTPTLSWECIDPDGDPLTYDVYFGTSSNPLLVNSGQSSTTYDPGTLNEETTYYWKIVTHDDHDNTTTGDIWEFTTTEESSGDIPTDYIAYYPFNGNANDESGNNHHGVVNGATLATDRFGNPNIAYSFDGDNDNIEVAHHSSFNSDIGLAISLWAKSNPVESEWRTMIVKGDNDTDWDLWAVQLCDGDEGIEGAITFYNGEDDYIGNSAIDDETWHHIVLTFDGDASWDVYVDKIIDVTATDDDCYNDTDILIGALYEDGGIADVFDGVIDDIRIYGRTLTEDEIQTLYHEGGWDE